MVVRLARLCCQNLEYATREHVPLTVLPRRIQLGQAVTDHAAVTVAAKHAGGTHFDVRHLVAKVVDT